MIYLCDNHRHLVCYPYSIDGLHDMARKFYIKKWWFHKDHYDIPKRRINEFLDKCCVVSSRDIYKIIKGEKEFTLLEKSKGLALSSHGVTNQFYGKHPYSFHLKGVVDAAERFITLIPEEKREIVLSACWLHDTEEDARITYNDIKEFTNEEIADIIHAVTNNRGKNRKERANKDYYTGILKNDYALFVKLCDRIANVSYSKTIRSSMFKKYQKEHKEFYESLYNGKFNDVWNYLNSKLFY